MGAVTIAWLLEITSLRLLYPAWLVLAEVLARLAARSWELLGGLVLLGRDDGMLASIDAGPSGDEVAAVIFLSCSKTLPVIMARSGAGADEGAIEADGLLAALI